MFAKFRAGCLAATALSATVLAVPAAAAGKHRVDSRDVRINALEAQVKALAATVAELRAAQEQTAAAQQQQAAQQQAQATQQEQIAAAQQKQETEVLAVKDAIGKPKAGPAVNVSLAAGKPLLATADGRFSLAVHGIMQLDTGFYEQRKAGPVSTDLRRSGPALGASATNIDFAHARNLKDGTVFRRGRFGIDGTVFGDFDYKLILDFGGTGVENAGQLYEAWVQYSGLKPLHLRVGAFSPSMGLEDQASTNTMPIIERAAIEDMARGLAGGDTRVGFSAWAATDRWLASLAVTGRTIGVLNTGTASPTAPSFGDQLGFLARLAGTPLRGPDWLIHLGVHGSYVIHPKNNVGPNSAGVVPLNSYTVAFSNTPELRADGTALISTGNINANHAWTEGLEFAAQKQNFFVQSEYERFGVDRSDPGLANPHFGGFYVEGGWMITGEARKYNTQTAAFDGPTVAHPFSLSGGGLGAFELVARYSMADLNFRAGARGTAPGINSIRGGRERNITVGLNWWPNPVVRFMFDFQHVNIDRLSPCTNIGVGVNNSCTGTASGIASWLTPVGAKIGQSYNAIGIRSQFAF